jgi:hypothetical protein
MAIKKRVDEIKEEEEVGKKENVFLFMLIISFVFLLVGVILVWHELSHFYNVLQFGGA